MRGGGLLLLVGLSAAAPVSAQPVSERPDAVSLVVYREESPYGLAEYEPLVVEDEEANDVNSVGLALITETRTVDVPAGRSRISFRGVVETIVPQTATVEGLPGSVLETDYDFGLLSPGSLLAAAVGERARLVRTNPANGQITETAVVVRSGPDGVVLEEGGSFEALGCGGRSERLVFDRAPAGLVERPTLSVTVVAPEAGRRRVRLSYLATGLRWAADYVARVRPDGRTLDLTGWITLSNRTASSLADAPTAVVAGVLAREEEERPQPNAPRRGSRCWGMDTTADAGWLRRLRAPKLAAPSLVDELDDPDESSEVEEVTVTGSRIRARLTELGDYKLYSLTEPTTVAARQTKQVAFLDETVRFRRVYRYETEVDDISREAPVDPTPAVLLRFDNTAASGLGQPLPRGAVTVLDLDASGASMLAGEQMMGDTAVGLPVKLELGPAMGVYVTPRLVDGGERQGRENTRVWARVEVLVENRKPMAVDVEYAHRVEGDDFRVLRSSRPSRLEQGQPTWDVHLAPGASARFSYQVRYTE